jgi:thiol-disulfide isomerase/thioredoxin
LDRLVRPARRPVAVALAACATAMAAAACSVRVGAANQGFVGASYASHYYPPGSRAAAPQVHGHMLNGVPFSLSADRGSVVVLNFWGSWCAPCRREAPALAALARRFPQVRFVGDDVHDSPATAEAFQRAFNIGYPSLNDPGEQVALAFRGTVPPQAIPTTLVIDRSGRIAAVVFGEVSYAGLHGLIETVLRVPAGQMAASGRMAPARRMAAAGRMAPARRMAAAGRGWHGAGLT